MCYSKIKLLNELNCLLNLPSHFLSAFGKSGAKVLQMSEITKIFEDYFRKKPSLWAEKTSRAA